MFKCYNDSSNVDVRHGRDLMHDLLLRKRRWGLDVETLERIGLGDYYIDNGKSYSIIMIDMPSPYRTHLSGSG